MGKGFGKTTMKSPKKRKAKAPEIGSWLSSGNRFSIKVSALTGNFLIVVDDSYCYDSVMRLPDAEKVLEQLIKYEKTHPLPNSSLHERLDQWAVKAARHTDDVPAIGFTSDGEKTVIDIEAERQGLSPIGMCVDIYDPRWQI